tara:strand:+ start:2077 stop:2340 length:264 start_codon:yes stop_codon:yes gene_type:complete
VKYVLVNKYDEIVFSVDLSSDVGINGATTYFQGIKQMPDRDAFKKLWKVMTQEQWDTDFKNNLQHRQLENRKYEWWKDDEEYLDIDK